jgi:hypothetical protein
MAVLSSTQHPHIVQVYACLADMIEGGGPPRFGGGESEGRSPLPRPSRGEAVSRLRGVPAQPVLRQAVTLLPPSERLAPAGPIPHRARRPRPQPARAATPTHRDGAAAAGQQRGAAAVPPRAAAGRQPRRLLPPNHHGGADGTSRR